jgi:hypothetical protein
MVEGSDSTMTLLPVITFATSCKSSGGVQLEDSSFKAMSISNVSAIMNETRKESLITVECYTRTSGHSVTLTEACDGTHVVIYQRKPMTFCVADFDRKQGHDEMRWETVAGEHIPSNGG